MFLFVYFPNKTDILSKQTDILNLFSIHSSILTQSSFTCHVKQLQTVNTSLQTEKFETAIEISKLQSQLETDRMKRESTHTKLETNIRLLNEDNEKLREKLCQQKDEFEKLMTDYKLLK